MVKFNGTLNGKKASGIMSEDYLAKLLKRGEQLRKKAQKVTNKMRRLDGRDLGFRVC